MSSTIHRNYIHSARFHDFENRPRMLKEFLSDETFDMFPSSSNYGYNTKSCMSMVQLSLSKSTQPPMVLLRSRSKRAAATTISAIHRVINVVKLFQFASTKSPLVSSSHKLSRKSAKNGCTYYKGKNENSRDESEIKLVKVKDILRWTSFRDLAEDESKPFDHFPSSPNTCPLNVDNVVTTTTTTTTTTTSSSHSSCSEKSSWCDSDFSTAEDYYGESEEFTAEKCLIGQRLAGGNATLLDNFKGEWLCEESAQQSPVSVLDSPFREVGEFISSFYSRPANIERSRCMLMQRSTGELENPVEHQHAKRFEIGETTNIIFEQERLPNLSEEKALKLLKDLNLADNGRNYNEEQLIFDFIVHELSTNGKIHDSKKIDREILEIAKSWIDGDYEESYEWEVEKNRVAYVKDMETEVCWKNYYKQEQEEMVKELEVNLLNGLLDEILDEYNN